MYEELFLPNKNEAMEYGKRIIRLFYELGYENRKNELEKTDVNIPVISIPPVFRMLGIPSGQIQLRTVNIPHMIGFGENKISVHYRNQHDLTLQEMLEIPNMLSDPDVVFRSNTQPNSSLIVCKEVERRDSPVVLAMKITFIDNLTSVSVVLSGYEKDNNPAVFFSNLYKYGFCVYDAERSKYFESIKDETELSVQKKNKSQEREYLHLGPIPRRPVTCTGSILTDQSTTKNLPFAVNHRVLTKNDVVNKFKNNCKELIAIIHSDKKLSDTINRNLKELGFHTLVPTSNTENELNFFLETCTGIATERVLLEKFSIIKKSNPKIKQIGIATDFMPTHVFKQQMKTLGEFLNEEKLQINKRR